MGKNLLKDYLTAKKLVNQELFYAVVVVKKIIFLD